MAILGLPDDLLMKIPPRLDEQHDLSALVRTCRRFHHLFEDYLYLHNIRCWKSDALIWASHYGSESTACKVLRLGADVNATAENVPNGRWTNQAGLTALHFAAIKGHHALVKVLLEAGADPTVRTKQGKTPLYYALQMQREDIIYSLSEALENVSNFIVSSTGQTKMTALQLACQKGLWQCARYFLKEGADVDTPDAKGVTPLQSALLACAQPSSFSIDAVKTVKFLLDSGADQTQLIEAGSVPMPIRMYGLNHPNNQVRALFSDIGQKPIYKIARR